MRFTLCIVKCVSSSIVPKTNELVVKSTAACPLTNNQSPATITPAEYAPVLNVLSALSGCCISVFSIFLFFL